MNIWNQTWNWWQNRRAKKARILAEKLLDDVYGGKTTEEYWTEVVEQMEKGTD